MYTFLRALNWITYWLVPRGIFELLKKGWVVLRGDGLSREQKALVQKNTRLLNIHKGERCFILATGPSIRSQDLTKLKNEKCLALSDFYKHKDYQTVVPAYYCLVPLHEPFTEEDGIKRCNELQSFTRYNETFFFGLSDRGVFEKSVLNSMKCDAYFLNIQGMGKETTDIDLIRRLPNMSSVSIMALCIAIYLGFSEIYLLGCDHDNLWKWDGRSEENQLHHFYDGKPSIGYQHTYFDVDRTMQSHLKVREQYKWVNRVAQKKGIQIFNASPSSYINIFPRVNLDDIVGKP